MTDELEHLENEIRKAGLAFRWLSDIQRWPDRSQYEGIVPLLLEHLERPYSDSARSTIADLLVRKSRTLTNAWPKLVDLYKCAEEGTGFCSPQDTEKFPFQVKNSLANVLAKSFETSHLAELSELILDENNGPSRFILVDALRLRKKNPKVLEILKEIRNDPRISNELDDWGIEP